MAVQAKFFVREITRYAHSRGQVKVSLSPVTRGEGNSGLQQLLPARSSCTSTTRTLPGSSTSATSGR